jgi:hypothetical protein
MISASSASSGALDHWGLYVENLPARTIIARPVEQKLSDFSDNLGELEAA